VRRCRARKVPRWSVILSAGRSRPVPALIALHGCTGRVPEAERDGAQTFVSWGYALLVVDSFSGRGITQDCAASGGGGADRVLDAFGALHYLASRDFIDRERIAVIGYSQGGRGALSAAPD
jgi:dienelactone hydrolase